MVQIVLRRCIMAGDHKQLPPTIISRDAARRGLERTLMERAIKMLGNEVVHMLTTQYRYREFACFSHVFQHVHFICSSQAVHVLLKRCSCVIHVFTYLVHALFMCDLFCLPVVRMFSCSHVPLQCRSRTIYMLPIVICVISIPFR